MAKSIANTAAVSTSAAESKATKKVSKKAARRAAEYPVKQVKADLSKKTTMQKLHALRDKTRKYDAVKIAKLIHTGLKKTKKSCNPYRTLDPQACEAHIGRDSARIAQWVARQAASMYDSRSVIGMRALIRSVKHIAKGAQ